MNNEVLEKLQKMWENKILNFQQQKGEENIYYQNKIITLQSLSQNISSNRNEKDSNIDKQACLLRFINNRPK